MIVAFHRWILAAALAVAALTAHAQALQLPDFADLAERVGPAVVNIRTTARLSSNPSAQTPELDENDPFYEFFRRFFPQPGPQGHRKARSVPDPVAARAVSAKCRADSAPASSSRPMASC